MLFVRNRALCPPVLLRLRLVIMKCRRRNRQDDVEQGQEGKSRVFSLSLLVLIGLAQPQRDPDEHFETGTYLVPVGVGS